MFLRFRELNAELDLKKEAVVKSAEDIVKRQTLFLSKATEEKKPSPVYK